MQHLVFFPTTQLFSYIREDFLKIWSVEDLKVVMCQHCLCESILFFALSISRWFIVDLLSPSISPCLHEIFEILDATLENWMLLFRSHLSHFARSLSRCLKDLHSDIAFHESPSCMIQPIPASVIDSRSLIPNQLASISPPHIVLLLVLFPASTYSTWFCGNWTQNGGMKTYIERFMMLTRR